MRSHSPAAGRSVGSHTLPPRPHPPACPHARTHRPASPHACNAVRHDESHQEAGGMILQPLSLPSAAPVVRQTYLICHYSCHAPHVCATVTNDCLKMGGSWTSFPAPQANQMKYSGCEPFLAVWLPFCTAGSDPTDSACTHRRGTGTVSGSELAIRQQLHSMQQAGSKQQQRDALAWLRTLPSRQAGGAASAALLLLRLLPLLLLLQAVELLPWRWRWAGGASPQLVANPPTLHC